MSGIKEKRQDKDKMTASDESRIITQRCKEGSIAILNEVVYMLYAHRFPLLLNIQSGVSAVGGEPEEGMRRWADSCQPYFGGLGVKEDSPHHAVTV